VESEHGAGAEIARRKDEHLEICLTQEVESGVATGLGRYRLEYDALPEIDLAEVDLRCILLGRPLQAPLLVGAMTGGSERAAELNRRLARAASRVGVGMALGSQRAMLVQPELAASYAVREQAPDLPLLLGNLGAVQLGRGLDAAEVNRAVAAVAADGVCLHLNPLQEALQPGGDTAWSGLCRRLAEVAPRLSVPVLLKEVGAGISRRTAEKLARLPVQGVEVAGVGGTSWALVESRRAPAGSVRAEVGRRLAGFGVPTAESIRICREVLGDRLVLASGGIRTGMDVAVALALGADAVALARPLLVAAARSEDAVVHALQLLIDELRVICFCTGSKNLADLRQVRLDEHLPSWQPGVVSFS